MEAGSAKTYGISGAAPALMLACALGVAGCAMPPSSVLPEAKSTSDFSGRTCLQLVSDINHVARHRAKLEKQQLNAVVGDAVGVYMILLPGSKFGGDARAALADTKGTELALRRSHRVQCR